ncbi:MAG: right-handed parallel beta-helix repeat-containing protein [bacterium]
MRASCLFILGLVAGCSGIVHSVHARTWYVPDRVATVQAGINSAADGDTILIAPGIYFEHDITLESAVVIRGDGDDAGDIVIDALGLGRVFDCANQTQPAVLEGLTITGGYLEGGAFLENRGAGVRCQNGSLILRNCLIRGNSARTGGGLGILESSVVLESCSVDSNLATCENWAGGGGLYAKDSSPELSHCVFRANMVSANTPPGDGGAIFCNNSALSAVDCIFLDNSSTGGAGGIYLFDILDPVLTRCHFEGNSGNGGGALCLERSSATLNDCVFRRNRANLAGAVWMNELSRPDFIRCDFQSNIAELYGGGAVDCWLSDPKFTECVFERNYSSSLGGALCFGNIARPVLESCLLVDNEAEVTGGAIFNRISGHPEIINCTFYGNTATEGAGIYCQEGGFVTMEQTIVAFSEGAAGLVGFTTATFDLVCCDIFGNEGGDWGGIFGWLLNRNGNMCVDPLFCAPNDGNYYLNIMSPCLNDLECGHLGVYGVGCSFSPTDDPEPSTARWLRRNRPNPFNPTTQIEVVLPAGRPLEVAIYSVRGSRLATIARGDYPAGSHLFTWHGRDDADRILPSGTYLCRLLAGDRVETAVMTLVR